MKFNDFLIKINKKNNENQLKIIKIIVNNHFQLSINTYFNTHYALNNFVLSLNNLYIVFVRSIPLTLRAYCSQNNSLASCV